MEARALTCFLGYSSCVILFIAYDLEVARTLVYVVEYTVATLTLIGLVSYTFYVY